MSSAIVSRSQQVYSPVDLTTLLSTANFWVDFSDPACFTTSNLYTLASVTDKSSSPRTVTINGTVRYDAISKSIRISGAGTDFLTISGLQMLGTSGVVAQETVFVVGAVLAGNSDGLLGGSAGTSGGRVLRLFDNSGIAFNRVGGAIVPGSSIRPSPISYFENSYVFYNGVASMYLNGRFSTSGAYTITATENNQTIGRAAGNFLRGSIAELIIFQTALNDSQRMMITNYLINKWNVQTTSLTTPLSIPGCTLWLDGNDPSTIVYGSGTNVQQWSDKSGNNYHAIQNNAALQPFYDSTLKGVKFTASLTTNMPTTAPFSRTETVFAVVNLSATQGDVLGNNSSTRGREFAIFGNTAASGAFRIIGDNTTRFTGLIPASPAILNGTDKYVFSYINSVGSNFFQAHVDSIQDSVLTAAINYTAGTFTNIVGGTAVAGTTRPYDSYIYEIILFNTDLSVANRQDITHYLMNKWGIQRFPLAGVFPFYRSPFLRSFNPLDAPSCVIWLDAADRGTVSLVSSTTNITQWNDKSGNGNNAIAGTSPHPVYVTNSVNGLPSIRLRANFDYFLVNNNLTTTTFPSLCYFIVLNIATPQFRTQAGILSTDSAGAFGRSLGINNGRYEQEFYNGFNSTLPIYTANTWEIVSLQFSGTVSSTFSRNGTTSAATASGTGNNTTGFKIGSYVSLGSPAYSDFNANFDVAEIIVYGTVVRSYERQLIEGYLARKWGLLSNLPSTHLYSRVNPSVVMFSPLNLSAFCSLWLDGGDGTSIVTSGGVITQWNDKSGNELHAVSIGTGPTYNSSTNSIVFTGAQNLRGAATQLHNPLTGNWSVFAVSSFSDLSGVPVLFNYDSTPTRVAQFFRVNSGPNTMETISFTNTGSAIFANTTAAVTLNTTTLFGAVNTASNLTVYLNGANSATTAHGTNITTSNNFYTVGVYQELSSTGVIGAYTGNYFSGNVNEIILFRTDLTTVQRQLIEGYLAWKWKIQGSLPANHPYRTVPPL